MRLQQRSMIDRLTYVITEAARQCARAEPDQSKAPPVRPIALAVLTALRKPTPSMIEAAETHRFNVEEPMTQFYRVMIDRALAEAREP